ncbi:MAG: UDP-2,4-diacetamido-2,4,6-trideoxy-beta-L-altropyranose hydrolase [Deferribacteraceae bacterium]|jgi:spore coat polysaccharide biosynthesis predicted glycosyltransferase SpsG/RimJ/RimL family protein N-acetyltransferase|nr:UDP-2,4-diacetamido-2,4,6-trideoxy-beta-L-altropyranose hydrolase [Deferribacteraceae bacterium]
MSIVFLTEAGGAYGIGHMMRCESVAQALDEHWKKSVFIIDAPEDVTQNATERVYSRTKWQKDWNALRQDLKSIDVSDRIEAIFVDSYNAKAVVLDSLLSLNAPLFFMDDYNRLDYPEGTVINPEISATKEMYIRRNPLKVHAGIKYVPQRSDFWDVEYIPQDLRKGILVTLGGSGDQWCLISILKYLNSDEPVTVLAAGNDVPTNAIGSATVIYERQSPEEMATLIKNAKVIICGGGGTLLEAARCGTPAIVVEMADNQRNNIKAWTENGFAKFAGHKNDLGLGAKAAKYASELSNNIEWTVASRVGRSKVDGQGARKIAGIILNETEGVARSVKLKKDYKVNGLLAKNYLNCTHEEHEAILAARNTEPVRLGSVNPNILTVDRQQAFILSLNSSVTAGYWLVMDTDNKPLGSISITAIDYAESSGVLGYYKITDRPEKGVGKILVKIAVELAFKHLKLETLFAECLESNIASIKSMEAAGFVHTNTYERVLGGAIVPIRLYTAIEPSPLEGEGRERD